MVRFAASLILSILVSDFAAAKTPLLFDVQGKSLTISAPHITYDLKSSKGESLDFGNGLVFNDDSLKVSVANNELHVVWDTQLIPDGDLMMVNHQGKELWRRPLNTLGTWSYKDLKDKEGPPWNLEEKVRFCLRSEKGKGYTNICTASYTLFVDDAGLQLGRNRLSADPRLIIQNEDMKSLKGKVELSANAPAQFMATLKSGAAYDFISEPVLPVIKDMVQTEDEMISITASLPPPLKQESKILPGEDYGSWTRALGFEKTIGDRPDLWQAKVSAKISQMTFPGKSGGVFVYFVEIKDPPKDSERLYLGHSPTSGTYLSQDQFLLVDSQGDSPKVWTYEAPNKWEMHKISFEKFWAEVYRGSPGEASLRLTGVVTNEGSYVLMGEGHILWWFNDLFGWQNYYLSKQRWGTSAKYFSSLMDIPLSNGQGGKEDVAVSSLQLDVRYRLSPGLWERDETVGLIASYETVHLGPDNVPKVGAGVFWARSMPRSIDTWFSKLPYMNYPKWVDMEFLSFVASPDSDVNLKGDFLLNFHGKVLWTPSFFGEMGFGVKNYNYEFSSTGYGAKLTTFYGTLGLGINF